MAFLYIKQLFYKGEEYSFLRLDYILYTPFILLLWFYCLYFWFARINAEDLTDKILFSIFLFAGLIIPVFVLVITKDISFSFPLFINVFEPLKNKLLYGNVESRKDIPNFIILIASLLLLFISVGLSILFNIQDKSLLYGFFYYSFLFYFESYLIHKITIPNNQDREQH